MAEIFADGIKAIAAANGVLRIELMQLRHNEGANGFEQATAATLFLPINALGDVIGKLSDLQEKLAAAQQKGRAAPRSEAEDLDETLANL